MHTSNNIPASFLQSFGFALESARIREQGLSSSLPDKWVYSDVANHFTITNSTGAIVQVISCSNWLVEFNTVQTLVPSVDELKAELSRLQQLFDGRLKVRCGAKHHPLWQVFKAKRKRSRPGFSLSWFDSHASLIFYDENGSKCWAVDPSCPKPSDHVRSRLAHDELPIDLPSEIIRKEAAFIALQEFLILGEKPTWLTYRCVE